MKRISVRVCSDGRIQAETHGIKGRKCTDYIRILEEILKAETVDSSYTSEYYEAEEISVERTQEQNLREGD